MDPALSTPCSTHDIAVAAADPMVGRFAALLRERHGTGIAAIVLYGSFLRGRRDTVFDFYVVLDDYDALPGRLARIANRLLPPNVHYVRASGDEDTHAAKYATIAFDHFERAVSADFHPYFWARFAQPAALVYARDAEAAARFARLADAAAERMLGAALPMMPAAFTAASFWVTAFSLTYGCELRTEQPGRAHELYATHRAYLDRALERNANRFALAPLGDDGWRRAVNDAEQRRARRAWQLRRVQGKLLSAARLVKAAFTFDEPLDYILWKIERHSGVHVEPTARQRRHPLLFAWPLLWRIYRRGGFR